jgi:hypothetical protein
MTARIDTRVEAMMTPFRARRQLLTTIPDDHLTTTLQHRSPTCTGRTTTFVSAGPDLPGPQAALPAPFPPSITSYSAS